ncbi:HEAT repeat-containing protein 6 [Apophysomyces ossiformis]|uniref:HEAT repeat-containing protein 6 n=1 Tax=Apophysomyces ossiformis TaxID=679940 RepID=A0A8H7BID9_9FUNG|nr:HEAT repeat-containing protein 6 [Apophysomyces ossiformis]
MARPANNQKLQQQFQNQLVQLHSIALPNNETPTATLALLNNLNNTDHFNKDVSDQQIIDLIVTGCKVVGVDDDACSALCKFMFKQCSKQIRLSSLRQFQLDACMAYLLDGLETDAAVPKVDMLRALSALVFENASSTSKFHPRIAKVLLALADRNTKPLEIRRMAINCIGNVCAGAGQKLQPYYKDYYDVVLSNVCTVNHTSHGTMMVASPSLDFTDSAVRKVGKLLKQFSKQVGLYAMVASSTLRAIQFLLLQDKTLVTNPLCDIIQIIYTFIFMHVSVQAYSTMGAKVPTASTSTSSQTRPGHLRPRVPSQPIRPVLTWRTKTLKPAGLMSSDSELSDSESISFNSRKQRDDSKIRINALLCLAAIAKTSPRVLYAHWYKFIPDTFATFLSNHTDTSSSEPRLTATLRTDNQPFSLFTILLYDPTASVRSAVCNTLVAMLDGSKQYLSIASDRESKSSFTSRSEQLAAILRDVHSGLVYALLKEEQPQVLILIMKVICTLVANCPYDRLAKGYLSQLYQTVMAHWQKASTGIRTSVLQVVTAILDTKSRQDEVSQLVESSSLVDSMLEACHAPERDGRLRIEIWQTFSMLAKTQFALVFKAWSKINCCFEEALNDSDTSVRVAALKFAESYGYAIDAAFTEEAEDIIQARHIAWWTLMLEKYIQQSSLDEAASVRMMTCDCIASMSKHVFSHFAPRYQRLSVTLLLPLASDQDANVRAAACRALGVFVLFPDLREDPLFVSDMAAAVLEQTKDKTVLVRVRASWAQGNLCDAMVLESEKEEFHLQEWIPVATWVQILENATAASLDNDKNTSWANALCHCPVKIQCSSLLRVTPKPFFESGRVLIRNAMAGLIKNIETGSLKTRWNACHAASNMLRNPDFPIGRMERGGLFPWTNGLYSALCQSLTQCKNFKVRINACLALAAPMERDRYGDPRQLGAVVDGILTSWDACENEETDYQEVRYKEQLKNQIVLALKHLYDWMPASKKITVDTLMMHQMTINK